MTIELCLNSCLLLWGYSLKKIILLILTFWLSTLAHAEVDKYIYSTKEEVLEILASICDNPEFTTNFETPNNFENPRYYSCSEYPNYGQTILGNIAIDFVKGNFTGKGLDEGILITGKPEADWIPRYVLVQKRLEGWYPIIPEEAPNLTNFIYGFPFTVIQGVETDVLVTLDGVLQSNDYDAAFHIDIANFKDGIATIETIFQMVDIPFFWQYCRSYLPYRTTIADNSPLAQFDSFKIQDIDNNGFEDIILNVSLRYWQNPSTIEVEDFDCDAIYNDLLVEQREVIFSFNGYDFTPYKNVEWLQNIYTSEK